MDCGVYPDIGQRSIPVLPISTASAKGFRGDMSRDHARRVPRKQNNPLGVTIPQRAVTDSFSRTLVRFAYGLPPAAMTTLPLPTEQVPLLTARQGCRSNSMIMSDSNRGQGKSTGEEIRLGEQAMVGERKAQRTNPGSGQLHKERHRMV